MKKKCFIQETIDCKFHEEHFHLKVCEQQKTVHIKKKNDLT